MFAKAGNILWTSCKESVGKGIFLVAFSLEKSTCSQKCFSIGICATIDHELSRFFSKSIKFFKIEETVEKMATLFNEAFRVYISDTKQIPCEIIFLEKLNI